MDNQTPIRKDQLLGSFTVVEWAPEHASQLTHIAMAFCGRLLLDLGAKVQRVSLHADPLLALRSHPDEVVGESSLLHTFLCRDKSPLSVQDGLAAAASADVVLVGDVAQLEGLPATVARVLISDLPAGVGLDDVAVSELGIQGMVGLTDLFGEPGEPPLSMGGHQTAYATGYAAFCACMASMAQNVFQKTQDVVRVNALDALAWVNWKGVAAGALGFPITRAGQASEAPVLACADGYFAFLHLPNNWPDIVEEVADPRLQEEMFASPGRRAKHASALNIVLAEWAAGKSRDYLYEFCQRCAIPGGPVLHGHDLLTDALYNYRRFFQTVPHSSPIGTVQVPGVPLTVEDVVAGTSETAVQKSGRWGVPEAEGLPLAGMLVLDLGIFTAGSVTSTLLADLGARVIKVESETYSDPFRIWPGIKGDSPLFTFNNRNKLGVNLDLKTPAGRERFLQLVAQADVVVENFRRGVLGRLGIDFPVLQQANPNIVLASISGQGAAGPGSGHVSFGSTLEAIGGVAALTGYTQGPCYISGRNLNYPDQIVCLYGAGATVAAILKAREAGVGMHIDVSQREVTTLAVGEQVAAASMGLQPVQSFPANTDLNAAFQDIVQTADGWVCVTVPRDREAQVAVHLDCAPDDLAEAMKSKAASTSSAELLTSLRAFGVAAFMANHGAAVAAEPAISSGGAFARTPRNVMVKGFPFQFDKTPLRVYAESPAMGEHTEVVLETLLGDQRID